MMDNQHVLGDTTKVKFTNFADGVEVDAKVDSGATTSSLHADSTEVNGNQITFTSKALGGRRFTMDLAGHQEVHSADGGANERPTIKVDIEVDGVQIQGVVFNLNDRSNMDTPVLVGQNVLKAGNFVIDVAKDGSEPPVAPSVPEDVSVKIANAKIIEAIEILAESDMTIAELLTHMRTVVVRNLKDD
jgi:hypothetical protein